MGHVCQAVARWVEGGGPLRSDITSPEAAREIGIPGNQLTAWVTASGYDIKADLRNGRPALLCLLHDLCDDAVYLITCSGDEDRADRHRSHHRHADDDSSDPPDTA